MSDNIAKSPQIRFAGFKDAWEQRKAKDLFNPIVERGHEKLPVLSVTQEFGVVYREEVGIDIKYDPSTLKDYKVIQPGDFVISLRSFQGGFELSDKLGITSPAYTIFKPKEANEQDNLFWKIQFKTFKFIESLKTVTFGIRDGKSISFSEFGDLPLHLPSNRHEQMKIGEVFTQLDNLITLQKRKYDKLVIVKKSMLEKMLPKDGANVPEIRIAGFTDVWEQWKLGELAESFEYGLNASATEFDGENKYLRITDIDDETHEFKTVSLTSPDIDLSSADNYRLQEGDVLFARTGASVGKTYRYKDFDGIVYFAGFLIRARIKPEYDSEFLFQNTLTERYNRFITISSQRSGQPGVNAQEYAGFIISVPKFDEQRKIGSFFQEFDHLIALHKRELNSLENLKKSLLQQMFI